MRLSHNLASLNIFNEQSKILKKQGSNLEKISSGYKINKTKDDPNAIAQSERLRMHIRGTQMAARNVQDGVSMLQTAEGGLTSINEMLLRIRELTVQAGNGTNNEADREVIKNEVEQMLDGINDIANNTEFNGVKLLAHADTTDNRAPQTVSMPSGANVGENIEIPMYNILVDVPKNPVDFSDINKVGQSIVNVDKSLDSILSMTSQYGALSNRFESSYNNLNELEFKMQASESSIRDADIAEEMMEYSKYNILAEAGNAMMAQSNKFPQDILRILENMK